MTAPVRCRGAAGSTAYVSSTERKSTRCTAPIIVAATSGRTSVPARRTREAITALVMEDNKRWPKTLLGNFISKRGPVLRREAD